MRFVKGVGVIGIAFVVVILAGFVSAQGVPCSEAHVNYESPTPRRGQHLSISTDTSGAFDIAKKVVSDLGPNRWLVTVDPVYTKNPPWNTTIFVGDVGSDKPALKIVVRDHGDSIKVKWVTERLLLVNIWWGRFGMSDWLIDVERRKVVYDELLNYYEEYSCTH